MDKGSKEESTNYLVTIQLLSLPLSTFARELLSSQSLEWPHLVPLSIYLCHSYTYIHTLSNKPTYLSGYVFLEVFSFGTTSLCIDLHTFQLFYHFAIVFFESLVIPFWLSALRINSEIKSKIYTFEEREHAVNWVRLH